MKNKEHISINDLPIIPNAIDPDWYINDNTGILLHELFQEKLAENENITIGADTITQRTEEHIVAQTDEKTSSYVAQQEVAEELKKVI